MGRFLAQLAALATFTSLASAGIKITSPKAGDKFTAGNALEVKWDEGGTGPDIADLSTYEVYLCAGPNTPDANTMERLLTPSGSFAAGGKSVQGKTDIAFGGDKPANAYYIKIIATPKKGAGQLTVFSDRFSSSGSTGTFSQAFIAAMKDVSGTTGPKDVDTTTGDKADASKAGDDEYDVEYTMQTGPTRYAPMQPIPPTKITKKDAKPLHPTSSVKLATKPLPIPSAQITVTQSRTQGQTRSVSSMENTVAAQPKPSDDMAKFLRRWED